MSVFHAALSIGVLSFSGMWTFRRIINKHSIANIVSLLAKEDEGSYRELCKQVVDEWMQRETERMTKAEEGKEKAKELAGEQ